VSHPEFTAGNAAWSRQHAERRPRPAKKPSIPPLLVSRGICPTELPPGNEAAFAGPLRPCPAGEFR